MGRFRRTFAILLSFALLSGCARRVQKEDETLHILATTYPVYLFTTAVVGDTEGVKVELLVNSQTSCLHDYTLTVKDMKAIDRADVIVMNGAGLEDFMADALAQKDVPIIDCSYLAAFHSDGSLHYEGDDDHHHDIDPHIWMDTVKADMMILHIYDQLWHLDEPHREIYTENCSTARLQLGAAHLRDFRNEFSDSSLGFITFHDGFQYFAEAFGLNLLKAIEEEEGATASAAEIKEIVALIEENHIPAIFVEKNGSRKTADVIARETGCSVYELDMLMSGDGEGIQPYIDAIDKNLTTILEAFS